MVIAVDGTVVIAVVVFVVEVGGGIEADVKEEGVGVGRVLKLDKSEKMECLDLKRKGKIMN